MAEQDDLPLDTPKDAPPSDPPADPPKDSPPNDPPKDAPKDPPKDPPKDAPPKDGPKDPPKDAPKDGEPVDYAKAIAEVQMPEGVVIDPVLAKAGGELFAKHKMSPEAAKEFTTLFAQQLKAGAEGNAKAFSDAVAGWKTDAEKNTSAEERASGKAVALALFGKDELALLEHFGVTNRAGFIKSMTKLAPAIQNDKLVLGNAAAGDRDARSHFPNSNMNP